MLSRFHVFAFAVATCLGPSACSQPVNEANKDPIFIVARKDARAETVEKLFKPFVAVVQSRGLSVVDVDEATLVTDTVDGEKIVSNRLTRMRYARRPDEGVFHFSRVFDGDSPSDDAGKPGVEFSGRDSRLKRAAKAAEIKELLLKQRRNPRLVSGAMIFTENNCFAKKLKDESVSDVSEKLAKRVAGFIPLMHLPIMTSSDALYGYCNPTQVTDAYKALPINRIEVFEDGSHRVVWALMNGRMERRILFSKSKKMLPVQLEDWAIKQGKSESGQQRPEKESRLVARTITKWQDGGPDGPTISQVFAKYSGIHAASTKITSNFSYEKVEPRKDVEYFLPRSLGLVLPTRIASDAFQPKLRHK